MSGIDVLYWSLVPVGLGLDIIGAVLLAVPDLPSDWQRVIRERTPTSDVRADHACAVELKHAAQSVEKDITEEAVAAWPLPRKFFTIEGSNRVLSEPIEVVNAPISAGEIASAIAGPREVVVHDSDGEILFRAGLENVYEPLEDRIDSWFRARGLGLLLLGFVLQLIGYVL